MSVCHNYDISIFDYIIPQFNIINKICISYDKTKLFLVAAIRLALFVLAYFAFNKYDKYIDQYLHLSDKTKSLSQLGLLTIILLNSISLITIIFKFPSYNMYNDQKINK